MAASGQFIEWREKRDGNRWSETLYMGLLVSLPTGEMVIVTRLSHGLRVLPYSELDQY